VPDLLVVHLTVGAHAVDERGREGEVRGHLLAAVVAETVEQAHGVLLWFVALAGAFRSPAPLAATACGKR
jgi:hypothetical protein